MATSMTLTQVRSFAMALPESTEEPHFQYSSFRVRGKIFATAPPEGEILHVFVSEEERRLAMAAEPDFLEELHWGKKIVGLRVILPAAKSNVVHQLLRQAWLGRAPKKLVAAQVASPGWIGFVEPTQ